MAEKWINELRRQRLLNERERRRYQDQHPCRYCGQCPSIHCDEFEQGGPACTPCRRDHGL